MDSNLFKLCLTDCGAVTSYPPFNCNAVTVHKIGIQPNRKVTLHKLGFLGPIDFDSFYDVTVQIRKWNKPVYARCEKFYKRIFAKQGEIFYFALDEPILLEPTKDIYWNNENHYIIEYTLGGPQTLSADRLPDPTFSLNAGGTKIFFLWASAQLAEVLVKEV